MAGVRLTAGAPGWISPGSVWWGGAAAAEVTVLDVLLEPRETDQKIGWGGWSSGELGFSVSLQPGWAGVRLSESDLRRFEGALHDRDRIVEPRAKAASGDATNGGDWSTYSAGRQYKAKGKGQRKIFPCRSV